MGDQPHGHNAQPRIVADGNRVEKAVHQGQVREKQLQDNHERDADDGRLVGERSHPEKGVLE